MCWLGTPVCSFVGSPIPCAERRESQWGMEAMGGTLLKQQGLLFAGSLEISETPACNAWSWHTLQEINKSVKDLIYQAQLRLLRG